MNTVADAPPEVNGTDQPSGAKFSLARHLARQFLADLARNPGPGLTPDPAAGGRLRVVTCPAIGVRVGPWVASWDTGVFRFDSPGIRGDIIRYSDGIGQPLSHRLLRKIIWWLELEVWTAFREDRDRSQPLVLTGDERRPIAPATAGKGGGA